MPGEELQSAKDIIVNRISDDVIKYMNKNTGYPVYWADPLKEALRGSLARGLERGGFDEDFNRTYGNALYKEDITDGLEYFRAGGNILPYNVDAAVIADVLDEFAGNLDNYFSGVDSHSNYGKWIENYNGSREVSLGDENLIKTNVMSNYRSGRQTLMAKDNAYDIGLKGPGESRMVTYGDGDVRSLDELVGMLLTPGGDRTKRLTDIFDNQIAACLDGESSLDNKAVKAEYKHFINLFSIDGKSIDYRETEDPRYDERQLTEAKKDIVWAVASGTKVEFTKFTMDENGKCKAETIPVVHANNARGKSNEDLHINGPSALKAAKLAKKITEKTWKDNEKKHKAFLRKAKKQEKDNRKSVIDAYKARIRDAGDRVERRKLRSELKAVRQGYREADREQIARQKAAERQRKVEFKAERRRQNEYIKQLSQEAKATIAMQKAQAAQRAKDNTEFIQKYNAQREAEKQAQAREEAQKTAATPDRVQASPQQRQEYKEMSENKAGVSSPAPQAPQPKPKEKELK